MSGFSTAGGTGGSSTFVHPGYVAGRWYWSITATVAASSAPTNDKVSLHPFVLSKAITVSDLGARIVTGVALGNIQLAIYASSPTTFLPDGPALAVTADIAATAAGVVSADITGSNVTLQPGLYWGAVNASSVTIIMASFANAYSFGGTLVGSATLANVSAGTTSASLTITFPSTYGTWPTATGQTFTEVTANSNSSALLLLKAA